MNHSVKIVLLLLFVLLLTMLLCGCSGTPEDTETTELIPVGSVADVANTDEQTTFVDICRTGKVSLCCLSPEKGASCHIAMAR